MLQSLALDLESTSCLVAVRPSQEEATVCFCGCARCFCGFSTVDMRPSHLGATGCPAHVSVARLAGSLDFHHQQAHSYIFNEVHWLFTSGSYSCGFPSLIWYYLWALRWGIRAISPPRASTVHVTSRGWWWHSIFGIHLQQGKSRQKVRRSAGRHTSEERKKRVRLSVGEGITWEKLKVQDKDWATSGNKWIEGRSWDCWRKRR